MSPARASSLLLDVYGAYVRGLGGWIAVADLVALLRELGVDEQTARSSVSRALRRGLLVRRRAGSRVGYELSAPGERLLAEGDEVIFAHAQPADLADGWVLAVFSVPEDERGRRYQLRTRLAWLGFGNLGAGVWLAPHRVLAQARETVEHLDLTESVELFTAHHAAFGDARDLVARCWDLVGLDERYAAFVADVEPVLTRWRRRGDDRRWDREAFVDYTPLLHEWRKLPFLDPGLPAQVLPDGWHGQVAADRFAELVARLTEPASRYVASVAVRRP